MNCLLTIYRIFYNEIYRILFKTRRIYYNEINKILLSQILQNVLHNKVFVQFCRILLQISLYITSLRKFYKLFRVRTYFSLTNLAEFSYNENSLSFSSCHENWRLKIFIDLRDSGNYFHFVFSELIRI